MAALTSLCSLSAWAQSPASAPSTVSPPASSVASAIVTSGSKPAAKPVPTAPGSKKPAPSLTGVGSGPAWTSLTRAQQTALAPLRLDWAGIESDRKQKWLQVADRFSSLSPAERERVQARMTEWARLSPQERGRARLQFLETTRHASSPDREAKWAAYQALPPEQKKALAQRALSASSVASTPAPRTGAPDAKKNVFTPQANGKSHVIAGELIRANAGATTSLITKSSPGVAASRPVAGESKINAAPHLVNRVTLLPKPGAAASAAAMRVAPRPASAAGVAITPPIASSAAKVQAPAASDVAKSL